MTRVRGGSKKGVYRRGCADGFSAILYVWSRAEDYSPAEPDAEAEDVFTHAGVGGVGGPPARPGAPNAGRCEQIVLDRALRHLDRAAGRVPPIADARSRLAETLRALAAAIEPRAEYALIHGELGPDHVLVTGRREPVVIYIEGTMYFDAEWEHVFLRLRFGQAYRWLLRTGSTSAGCGCTRSRWTYR